MNNYFEKANDLAGRREDGIARDFDIANGTMLQYDRFTKCWSKDGFYEYFLFFLIFQLTTC